MKIGQSDIAIIVTAIIVMLGTAFTLGTDFRWVPQDLAAIPGLFFLIAAVLVGAMLVGRIKITRPQGANLFKLHRKIGAFFAILMVVTLAHGLYDRIDHGELLFWQHTEFSISMIHGWVGLIVTVLALLQVIPSLTIKDRRTLKTLHLILGYALLILVIVEVMLGVGTALAEIGEIAGD